jgi:heat shock protein HslJ
MCCPTLEVQKRWSVHNNRLLPVANVTPARQPSLRGATWQWVQTLYNDGKRVVPAKPSSYTVRFLEEGKFNAKADCNLKGGTYSTKDKKLAIKLITSTMAACEPGSLEDEFVRNLGASVIHFLRDGDLYIALRTIPGQ